MRRRPAMRLLVASLAVASAVSCSDDSPSGEGDGDAGDAVGGDAAPLGAFESFRYSTAAGLCPDDMDCVGFIELTSDRVLLVDRNGELPVVVHQAEVTVGELDEAISVLTDRALIAILDLGEPPCLPPSDVFEEMTLLEGGGRRHSNSVTFCEDAPIAAARARLRALADAYFP